MEQRLKSFARSPGIDFQAAFQFNCVGPQRVTHDIQTIGAHIQLAGIFVLFIGEDVLNACRSVLSLGKIETVLGLFDEGLDCSLQPLFCETHLVTR
jgi:hypothetical protein